MAGGATATAVADGQLATGGGIITSVTLVAGSDAPEVILYDNTAASGTILMHLKTLNNTSITAAALSIAFSKGVYADISGADSPRVLISYE